MGTRLDDWELVSRVAEGHVTTFYQARVAGQSTQTAPGYAVKLLEPRFEQDARAIAEIEREAHVGRQVTHPHLVPILAARVSRAPYYVVMPWLVGSTLAELLAGDIRPGVAATLWIARQVAEALDALHAKGWMHADIKPSNIFLSAQGHVTLLDLGFARHRDEQTSALDRCVTGTPEYMAPEMVTSTLRPDIRSDLYSLGVTLYKLLSGRLPFLATEIGELLQAHRQAEPPELRRLVPAIPLEVSHLVRELMAKEPLRRPQSPRELIERLFSLEIKFFADRSAA
ncbi:MAG: serine/threonine protein kinase [Pirellulales bacterium]|nr:serine/threonine protein kinase [Pirellulales bacterium]